MTENKTSKVLAYISAVLSGIFILIAADVIIFQKKLAELWNVPKNTIEASETIIPYSGIACIILAFMLIAVSVRVITKKYTNSDALAAAVLWGVMWLSAFAAGSIQVHYTWKSDNESYVMLVTLNQLMSMLAALLVLAAVMAIAAADCAAFVYNRRKSGKTLPKAAISFSAVYIFATLVLMLLVRDEPVIIASVIILWISGISSILASIAVMSGKGGAAPLVVSLVIFSVALSLVPVCNMIQSSLTAVTKGLQALADYGVVSGLCGKLAFILYIGTALTVCGAARNVYNYKDTSSERIDQI